MKVIRIAVTAAVASLVLVGCGRNNPCETLDSAYESLQGKKGTCNDVQITSPSKAPCDANIDKCSDADLIIIEDQADCLQKVTACESGNEFGWLGQIAACGQTAQNLSADCRAAFADK